MADNKDQKDIKPSSGPIPEGWLLDIKVKDDGTVAKSYYCPPTDQRCYTYEELMRYVTYAKKDKVSIYGPNFGAYNYLEREDDFAAMKREGQGSMCLNNIKIKKDIKGKQVLLDDE